MPIPHDNTDSQTFSPEIVIAAKALAEEDFKTFLPETAARSRVSLEKYVEMHWPKYTVRATAVLAALRPWIEAKTAWLPIKRDSEAAENNTEPFDGKRYLVRTRGGITGQNVWVSYWSEDDLEWMVSAPGFYPRHAISSVLEYMKIHGELPAFPEPPLANAAMEEDA